MRKNHRSQIQIGRGAESYNGHAGLDPVDVATQMIRQSIPLIDPLIFGKILIIMYPSRLPDKPQIVSGSAYISFKLK